MYKIIFVTILFVLLSPGFLVTIEAEQPYFTTLGVFTGNSQISLSAILIHALVFAIITTLVFTYVKL
jgi:hypothetical protein